MKTVDFETAKLAKEKGFDEFFSKSLIKPIIFAYQYQLIDWLREKHNLHIEILYDYENDSTSYHYTIRHLDMAESRVWGNDFATYEECLETALKEALKGLNND